MAPLSLARILRLLPWLPFLWPLPAAADAEALAQIRALLGAHPGVRAEFVQTRTSPDLARPAVARGSMLAWSASGVIWTVQQPVRSTVVLREDTTVQIDANGARSERRARDDAAAARIGRVLRSLLQGDIAALAPTFDISATHASGSWSIALTPRQGPMSAFLKSLQVRGRKFVESVLIEEQQGDATHIQFVNLRDGAPLSPDERELLGLPR